jgi:hypothetical protein
MLRKLLLGTALAALTLGTASVATAQPVPRHPDQPSPQPYPTRPAPQPAPHFHVMYRICEYEPWELYRTVDCHDDAHALARALQRRGYEAKVIHH